VLSRSVPLPRQVIVEKFGRVQDLQADHLPIPPVENYHGLHAIGGIHWHAVWAGHQRLVRDGAHGEPWRSWPLVPPLQRSSSQAAPSATPISVRDLAYSGDCRTMSTNLWMAPVDRRPATQRPSS
jgi:hypothetical protein